METIHQADVTHLTDDALLAEAKKALDWFFWIPKERIRMEASDGWITLAGTVDWYFQRSGAEKQILLIPGLRGMTNNIVVDQRQPTEPSKQFTLR
jgi:hypothetical protein